mmetsp:Transcript_51650/g.85826  ORF Transcript_51650/g.85826 Transcript_51650/m.85826 type:complete len:154 (-) Transcript_51650:106-567(-)
MDNSLAQVFAHGFPLLHQYMFQLEKLMEARFPAVLALLKKEGLDLSLFADKWFLTVLLYEFPFPTVVRVWDSFLFDGVEVIFRTGLALIQILEAELMGLRFEELIKLLQTGFKARLPPSETFMKIVNSIDVPAKELDRYRQMYGSQKKGGHSR